MRGGGTRGRERRGQRNTEEEARPAVGGDGTTMFIIVYEDTRRELEKVVAELSWSADDGPQCLTTVLLFDKGSSSLLRPS